MCYCDPSNRTPMCGKYACRKALEESGEELKNTSCNKHKYPNMPKVRPPKVESELEKLLQGFLNLQPESKDGGLDYKVDTKTFTLEIKYTKKEK